jgi:FkbM family methyltransferase
MWWCPASRGKVFRYLLGTYEEPQTEFFCRNIRPGDVFIDIGANLGYYTLLASRLVGDTGAVFAFEPSPEVFFHLRNHVSINKLKNVSVHEAALGSEAGTARFFTQCGSGTGRVSNQGNIEVEILRLDDVLSGTKYVPTYLKIDVEGSADAVFRGAENQLRKARPLIYLSLHGDGESSACTQILSELGYEIYRDSNDELIAFDPSRKPLWFPEHSFRRVAGATSSASE